MKKALIFCALLACLLSCADRRKANLSDESRHAIEILQMYQNVDPQLALEYDQLYQMLLNDSASEDEITEEYRDYFMNNLIHIDSVVNHGISLAEANMEAELLALLEEELFNFYAHPHNTIDTEVALHLLIIDLTRKHADSHEEFVGNAIYLLEYSMAHLETLETPPSYYTTVLTHLIMAYFDIEDYQKAAAIGEQLSLYVQKTEDKIGQICTSVLLSKAYEGIGMTEKQDSCINSVRHLPQFAATYAEVKEILD